MAHFKLIGIRKVDFTDTSTGAQIVGNSIFVTHKIDGVIGEEGKKYFVRSSVDLSKVSIGDNIDLFFNDKGKVDAIIPLGK